MLARNPITRLAACLAACITAVLPTGALSQDAFEPDPVLSEESLEDEEAALAVLRESPLDLATDPLAPLEAVPGAPPGFAARAEAARALLPLRRVEDLLRVSGVDGEFLSRLRPFVREAGGPSRVRGRVAWEARWRRGERGPRLLESADFRRGDALGFGGLIERDAGERSVADFASWWMGLSGSGGALLLGALDVDLGMGLALSTARPPIDGAQSAVRALRLGRGITPHRGTGEEGHLRGAAVRRDVRRATFLLLVSRTRRDARVGDGGAVTSLAETGLHRTRSERAARDRLEESMAAARAEWRPSPSGRIGATIRRSLFDPPLGPRAGSPLPSADGESVAALDVRAARGPMRLVWEGCLRAGGGDAQALAASLAGGRTEVRLLARRFDTDYRVLNTAPLGAGGRSSNERGLLGAIETRLGPARVEFAHDRHAELAPSSSRVSRARGLETRLSIAADREGRRAALRFARTLRDGGSSRDAPATRRTSLRVAMESPIGRGVSVAGALAGVVEAEGDSALSGGYAHAGLRLANAAGGRWGIGLTLFGGGSGSVVPRLAESLVPGPVRFVSLAASGRLSGARASLGYRKTLSRSARIALGGALHLPRRASARGEIALSFELGGANR